MCDPTWERYPSGGMVICSKSFIKGVMDENVLIMQMLLKTFLDKMMTITKISKIL